MTNDTDLREAFYARLDTLREAFMQETSETHCGNTWYGSSAQMALATHMAMNHPHQYDDDHAPDELSPGSHLDR